MWTELRDAMHAAIVRAANAGVVPNRRIDASHVIWKFQDGGQPSDPYIALSVGSASNPGQDGLTTITDPLLGQTGARPEGEEVQLEVVGFREINLGLEIFTDSVADEYDALALGERIRSALLLPSVRDPLWLAGVTPFDPGPTQYVPSVVAIGFRGRAILDIRCFAPAQSVSDFVGYIASVGGTLSTTGGGLGPNARPFSAP